MKLINPLVILRILSTILLIETVIFLFCIPVALIYKESLSPFLWSAVITGLIFGILRMSTWNVDTKKLNTRDGYLAVTLSWILFSVLGTLPYILSNIIPSFIDAFFEASSGFSTTGSTVITDVEVLPYSILFWRSLTHWVGGLGIIVVIIIILPSLKISAHQLFSMESSLREKIHPKTKAIGWRLLFAYLGLTIIEIVFLSFGDMNLFESICHSFGTVATGGFSTSNSSISGFSAYTQSVITIFMFLSGISFVVYYYIVKLKFNKVIKNEELWFYFGTVLVTGILASGVLIFLADKPLELAIREGFFQVISIITTTGYVTTDYLLWPAAGIILLFVLLFAGGSTGSTAGSIKMARHLISTKNIRNTFSKLLHPNMINQIRFNGKPVSERTNITVVSFIVLYLFIFLMGTFIVTISGLDVVSSASAVASSLGNVGPGMGLVGPMFNFSGLPEFTKLILAFLMIIGRLEILTVFALFSKSFWRM